MGNVTGKETIAHSKNSGYGEGNRDPKFSAKSPLVFWAIGQLRPTRLPDGTANPSVRQPKQSSPIDDEKNGLIV